MTLSLVYLDSLLCKNFDLQSRSENWNKQDYHT